MEANLISPAPNGDADTIMTTGTENFQAVFIEENIVKTELDPLKVEIEYILP